MSGATSKHTCELITPLPRRACKLNACDPQLSQAALSDARFMPGSMLCISFEYSAIEILNYIEMTWLPLVSDHMRLISVGLINLQDFYLCMEC